jgi:FkbH-like protein
VAQTLTHDGANFRVPCDLEVTPTVVRRVLLVGQCILNAWSYELEQRERGLTIEHILFNFTAELPDTPSLAIDQYDFQIVAVPIRGILHESKFLRLSYLDTKSVEKLFADACDQMCLFLRAAMKWNEKHSILSFVANFLVPQQNPNGRLLPRYDLRNFSYFIERLNEHLAQEVATYKNAYLLDLDQVSASVGRRYVQDDSVCTIAHGSTFANFADDKDQKRIEPPKLPVTRLYNAKVGIFIDEVWREAKAMYRTLRQIDPVKMVIVDLDDTLWRGVLAEQDSVSLEAIEGWPLGVIDALAFLKKRGIILAIVSKNEESNVRRIFEQLLRHRLPLDGFALKRINWLPKSQNIAEIIAEANLLPKNVVFVDDNPVERAAVAASFPDLRIIGADPYAVRRILLWSPETQVATVTSESSRRSEMIQAQVIRETARKTLSREEFLNTLNVEITFLEIASVDNPQFPRAFELLNKTNQFNTTGKRWTLEDISRSLLQGLRLICFSVEDKFTEYGLVGVVLLEKNRIVQYVMSCRVLGLDVEKAVLAYVTGLVQETGATIINAVLVETVANFPCRKLYSDSGFSQAADIWSFDFAKKKLPLPLHIRSKEMPSPASLPRDRMQIREELVSIDRDTWLSGLGLEKQISFSSVSIEPNKDYVFSNGKTFWLSAAKGLGSAEQWGSWTVNDSAVLASRLTLPAGEAMRLYLVVRPFLVSQSARRSITLAANGSSAVKWHFVGATSDLSRIYIDVPYESFGPQGELVLTLEIDTPCAPKDIGISDDPRRLGVGLISLSFEAT